MASTPPANLQTPDVAEWLLKYEVRQASVEAIKARLNGEIDVKAERQLLDTWSAQAGESLNEATNVVASLLAFIALSISRHLSSSEKIILAQQQGTTESILKKIASAEALSDAGSHAWVDKEVLAQLERALRRRFLPLCNFAVDLTAIINGFEYGELRRSTAKTQALVLGWLARAHAAEKKPAEARQALSKAMQLSAGIDLVVVEARVIAAEGDTETAYRLLRDRPDQEARTNLFVLLQQTDGSEAALHWFEDNGLQPSALTQAGLINLLEAFSKTAKWDDLASLAIAVRPDLTAPFPALLAITGASLMALAVTEQQRLVFLESLPFASPTIRFHDDPRSHEFLASAREHFAAACAQARSLGADDAAHIYEFLSRWLELVHPSTMQSARAKLGEDLKQPQKAIRLVRLAIDHNIEFDGEPIRVFLQERGKFGGWADHEVEAALFLSLKLDSPDKVVEFIGQFRPQLERFFNPGFLRSIEIQGLHRTGKTDSARHLLEASTGLIPEDARLRLAALLGSGALEEDTAALREVFGRTQALADLQELVRAMYRAEEWQGLIPFARQLFDLTRHEQEALLLVEAFQKTRDEDSLFEFLSSVPALIERSRRLRQTFGWALFSEGKLAEADRLLSMTADRDRDATDRNLYVAIAIESGDWDRLSTHVESEWVDRANRSAEDLLRVARIGLEVESGRVAQLLEAAVDVSPTDPNILVGAYGIATEAGLDDEKAQFGWLDRAIRNSGPEGPIQSVTLQELVDMQPDWNRQVKVVSDLLAKGGVPLFLAARGLRTTLTRLVLGSLQQNSNQADARRRMYIPTYHASSILRGVGQARSIALDLTSIYVLHFLDLLEATVAAFDKVYIAANTIGQMLEERQRVRFHQPSRTRESDAIRREVDNRRLKIATNFAPADPGLENEVGAELAKLVSTALRDGGTVIRPCPVPKLGSLGVDDANLANWTSCIFDTHELIAGLRKRGHISEAEEQRALAYLRQHDRRWHLEIRELPDGPIFIDGLALTYLWVVRLLHKVCDSWDEIYISQDTFDLFTGLDKAASESDDVVKSIDTLRRCLHRHISAGHIVISKRRRLPGPDDSTRSFPTMFMLACLPDADVIVVDDRFLNQHATITDAKRVTKPLLTSANILEHLRASGVLDELAWRQARQRLRSAGVGLVPLQADELLYHLQSVPVVGSEIRESLELRAIRENLAVVAIAQPIDPRTEGAFIAMCLAAIRQAIANLWDGRCSEDEARAKASWAVRLMTQPLDFVRPDLTISVEGALEQAFASHFAFLCMPLSTDEPARAKTYSEWMDQMLTETIREAFPRLASLVNARIKQLVEEFARA